MHNWDAEDYDNVDYRGLCPEDAEIVVFETEPCSAKAFPPAFGYYRNGRTILWFNFESLHQHRAGENPDYLSPELLAANLIGPTAECGKQDDDSHDCFDHHYEDHERLVTVIADYFTLPSPPLSEGVTAK
ncbi:hypothetical protein [Streptomyces sp. NBC_01353]|uniref:hypothetical protein n=1 Tax=Streptomyces sp. NBC_01353 TaxID=2903835 RepID=UPI002E3254EC|nr:hypothetical protein [Streptomyces sp. NBC_01353]